MDNNTTIETLKEKIKLFCEEREWDEFHNAKDLAIALSIESSEFLQHFRFKSEKEVIEMFKNKSKKTELAEEMSDVLFCLLRISQKYNIDLVTEFNLKLEKNKLKYPIEKAKGNNKKYSEY